MISGNNIGTRFGDNCLQMFKEEKCMVKISTTSDGSCFFIIVDDDHPPKCKEV